MKRIRLKQREETYLKIPMHKAKPMDLTHTQANLMERIPDQISVDHAKRAAMFP